METKTRSTPKPKVKMIADPFDVEDDRRLAPSARIFPRLTQRSTKAVLAANDESRQRNDAGLAAAELALAVEKHVLDSGSIDTVGTVGVMELHPGAVNSIPSKAHIEIDTRDIDEERRNFVIKKIQQSAARIAENRGVKLSKFKIVNQDPPALSSNIMTTTMEAAANQLNLSFKLMISRAYHDSLFMARISPMGMIFIPCYKGYSHKPEEFASAQDIANGVSVLALTLAKLSHLTGDSNLEHF